MAISNRIFEPVAALLSDWSASPLFEPGTIATGNFGGKWLYCQAAAALTAGQFVVLNHNYVASALTTANSPRGAAVAVAPNLAVPINAWFWAQIEGQAGGLAAAAIAAGARINTTATVGAVDDDGTVGAKEIVGVCAHTAVAAAGVNELQINRAVVGATI